MTTAEILDRRFVLEARLGAGASGEVWRATDRLVEKPVAVKILHRDQDALRTRWREIAALRRLQIPGVARLRHIGGGGDRAVYLVTDLVEGAPFLRRELPVTPAEIAPQFEALLETLAVVHGQGLAHGDLKPDNILVDDGGRPVLVDFGFATAEAARDASRRSVQGSPAYMAPEVFRGQPPGAAADLYAVGLMAYEALLGEPLHDTSSRSALLRARLGPPPADLRERLAAVEGLPSRGGDLVASLLAPDPQQRPTAAESLRRFYAEDEQRAWPLGEVRDELSLRSRFKGPEIAFHIPSDAAHELWRRSSGRPDEMVEELEAWRRMGLVQRHDDGIAITRASLDRLKRMPLLRPPATAAPTWSDLARRLAFWGRLIRPAIGEELLRELTQAEPEAVGRAMQELEEVGVVRPHPLGWQFHPLLELDASSPDDEQRVETLLRLLPEEHPARPELARHHGEPAVAQQEALRHARRLHARGHVRSAVALLREAVVERSRQRLPVLELLSCWTMLVEAIFATDLIEELLWWLEAQPTMTETFEVVSLLHATLNSDARTALETLESAPSPADPKLQWAIAHHRFRASQYLSVETSEAVLADIRAWAGANSSVADQAVLEGWQGMIAYRHGRYLESAELHRQASERKEGAVGWLSSRINEIWGLVDGLEFARAQDLARELIPVARDWEHSDYEMRLVWLERFATHRLGREPLEPSEELLEAARATGLAEIEGRAYVLESSIAWYAGRVERALALGRRAREIWLSLGAKGAALYTECFLYFIDPSSASREVATIAAEAAAVQNQRLRILALGMLQSHHEGADLDAFQAGRREYEGLDERERSARQDFISMEEAWGPVGPAPSADGSDGG